MDEIQTPVGVTKKNRLEPAHQSFFFERHDGSIICVKEREAWTLLKGGNKVIGIPVAPPRLIGVSDGQKFRQAVQEAHVLHEQGKYEEASDRLRLGEKEEIEAARGHIIMPRNFDTIDRSGNPTTR